MNRRIEIIFVLIKLLSDMTAVTLSFVISYWLRFGAGIFPVTKGVPEFGAYIDPMPFILIVYLSVFRASRFYEEHRIVYKTDEFLRIVRAVTLASFIIAASTFVFRQFSYSRAVLIKAYVIQILLLFAGHRMLKTLKGLYMKKRLGVPSIVIIGGVKLRDTLQRNILKHREYSVIYQNRIDLACLKNFRRENNLREIVLILEDVDRKKVLELIKFCESTDVEFKMVPDMLELKLGEMSYDDYFGLPVLALKHPLFEPSNYYTKRVIDILVSMCALTVLAPFLLMLIILIKLDTPGKVIYSQLRRGYKGADFRFFKFRSMVSNADDLLAGMLVNNERQGPVFKMKNDPRVTRIGALIRKYSIDEIPQLFNVLRGEMSLVGPRPQVIWEAENYDDEAKRRLNVLPGITGLWQVSGRSELSYEDMIKLDLYYLENWTPGFDIKILLKTISVVLLKKGAY